MNKFQGTASLLFSSVVFIVSGYLINVWLGKELGPIGYGIYGVIISLMTAVNIIQTSGLPQATSKFVASHENESDRILKSSLVIQTVSTLALTLLFFLLAHPLALLLNDASLTSYIRATSLILPLYAIFALYVGYYNGLHRFKKQALLNIVYSVAKLVSVIGLVYAFHLYGVIAGFILSPLVAILFGWRLPKDAEGYKSWHRKLIRFALPLTGFAVLSTLLISVDLFFVKALLHASESSGWYAAGQNIARIPYFALSAFALVLFPTVSKSVEQEGADETAKKIKDALRQLLLLLVPGTAAIALTSKELLSLLYSNEYLPASSSLSVLAVGLGFVTLFSVLSNIMSGAGKPGYPAWFAFVGVLIASVLCFFLIPVYGLLGAALATTVGGLVATACMFTSVVRRFPGCVPWASVVKIVIATLAMTGAGMILALPLLLLPVAYLILAGVYGGLLVLMRELSLQDILNILILKKLFSKRVEIDSTAH